MTFSELLQPYALHDFPFPEDPEILGITPDPLLCRPGYLFIGIVGFHRDGHDSLPTALQNGAVACIIDDSRPEAAAYLKEHGIPYRSLPDTRRAEAVLTSRFYGDPWRELHMTAVTGTNGKTSTVAMLDAMYSLAGFKTAVIGTLGGGMTTPDPAILYPKLAEFRAQGVTHVFMEASSHALALRKLAPIEWDTALFTNLTPDHLDFHGDMEHYAEAKAALFRQARRTVVNADDPYASYMASYAAGQIVTCSASGKPTDFAATHIRRNGIYGSSFDLVTQDCVFRISIPIPGDFSVRNAMGAAVAAFLDGIPKDIIRGALAGFRGVKGRMERIPLPTSDYTVYIDFAHTPDALENILRTARSFMKEKQRLVLLFGCGGDRDKTKRPLMGSIASHLADFVIVTADNSRSERTADILSDIMAGFDGNASHTVIEDRKDAIEYAISSALPGDLILLCGKGHEEYEIMPSGTHPFSEREIAQAAAAKHLRSKGFY